MCTILDKCTCFQGHFIGRVYMFKGAVYRASLHVLRGTTQDEFTGIKGHYIGRVHMFKGELSRTSIHV